MTPFKHYTEIHNSFNEDYMDEFRKVVPSDQKFYITEKVHGSNAQVHAHYEEDIMDWKFVCGSRNNYLQPGNKFYNFPAWVKNHEKIFYKFLAAFTQDNSQVTDVIFFGEIFGGIYPHKNVSQNSYFVEGEAKPVIVQHGIFYSPTNEWLCFDIAYSIDNGKSYQYIDYKDFVVIAPKYGNIPTVPLLSVKASLDEALNYPNDETSVVFVNYELPPIENNIMEGIVIRPEKEYKLPNGERAIIKIKNARFEEVRRHKTALPPELSKDTQEMLSRVNDYITVNRLNNVLSKLTEDEKNNIGLVIKTFSSDSVKSFMEDYHDELQSFQDEQVKQITKSFGKLSAAFVRGKLTTK